MRVVSIRVLDTSQIHDQSQKGRGEAASLNHLAGFWLVSARLRHGRLFPFRAWPGLDYSCGPWPPGIIVRVILRAHMLQDSHVDRRDGTQPRIDGIRCPRKDTEMKPGRIQCYVYLLLPLSRLLQNAIFHFSRILQLQLRHAMQSRANVGTRHRTRPRLATRHGRINELA